VLAGAVVVLASLLRRWLKLSLHAAFAVLAAALLWPAVLATLGVLALAAGVGWSRLVLQRHTRQEVVAGLLAGAAAGVAFRVTLA
jgi:membrane-associated phospholipid phosphatase